MGTTKFAYEEYFGTNFRKIKNCRFPEINVNRKYVHEFFLKSIFHQKYDAANKPIAFYLLRRIQQIIQLYDEIAISFNELTSSSDNKLNSYLNTLNKLEQIISLLYQIYQLIINMTGKKLYKSNDDSPLDRLNRCYNIIKHFEQQTLPANVIQSTFFDCKKFHANNVLLKHEELKILTIDIVESVDNVLQEK